MMHTYRFVYPTGYSVHMTHVQYDKACEIAYRFNLPHEVEICPVYGLPDSIGIQTDEMFICVLPDGSSHS